MEDIVIVDSNDYAQVVFDDVSECYLENNDLECKFSLNELLKPDPSDFIGIFKVGFSGLKDHFTTQPINCEELVESKENKGKVVFSSEKLPKDDGEFYQFVYVSQGKHIRGASIPFEFKRTHVNDYIQVLDDQDAIIIKTKESEINEALNDMKTRLIHLTNSNGNYEKLMRENDELIKLLKDEINMGKMRYSNVAKENEILMTQLNGTTDNLKLIQQTMVSLADENKNLKNKHENIINENRNMGELLQKRINQVELLRTEFEQIKTAKNEIEMILNLKEQELSELRRDKEEYIRLSNELKHLNVDNKISKLEFQINERMSELDKIKQDLRRNEQLVAEQQQTIQAILTERDSLNAIIQKLQKEKADIEESHDSMSQELLMKTEKLKSVEECKEVMRNQLTVMTKELEEANERLKENGGELLKLQEIEKHYSDEHRRLLEEINSVKFDYEMKLEQTRGSNFALNLAHQHLEHRVRSVTNKHEKELESEKQLNEKLKQENDTLKQRICAGAYEYALLNKKYLKLKSYTLNKIQLSNSLYQKLSSRQQYEQHQNQSQLNDEQNHTNSNLCESTIASQMKELDEILESKTDMHSHHEKMNYQNKGLESTYMTRSSAATTLTAGTDNDNSIRKTLYLPLNTLTPVTPMTPMLPHQRQQLTASASCQFDHYDRNSDLSTSAVEMVLNNEIRKLHLNEDARKQQQQQQQHEPFVQIVVPSITSYYSNNMNSSTATLDLNNNKPNTTCDNVKDEQEEVAACEICGQEFSKETDEREITEHITSHYGPTCPVCYLTFRKGYPQEDYETHVNGHFTN